LQGFAVLKRFDGLIKFTIARKSNLL
jgi:hypothetical protein